MGNSLEKIRVLDKALLSGENYFQSLLEQAQSKGLIGGSDIERVQFDCVNLLAGKVEHFNSGDSSSIRIETAQNIMASILFTIGLWLKTYSAPDDALAALLNDPVKELWQKGRKRIDTMVSVTKALHSKLLHQLVDTRNVFYRSTLEDGIRGFFKLYDPEYSAHEIHITADYPLLNPIPELAGIEFIKTYVEGAYYENQFCAYFSAENIHQILYSYEKGYSELLINIYEPVLLAAIGRVIAGSNEHRTDVAGGRAAFQRQQFSKMAEEETLAAVQKAAAKLSEHFRFSNGLSRYVQNSLPIIVKTMRYT